MGSDKVNFILQRQRTGRVQVPQKLPQLEISRLKLAIRDLNGKNSRGGALVVTSDTSFEELKPINETDVYNTALIFGIIAREESKVDTV